MLYQLSYSRDKTSIATSVRLIKICGRRRIRTSEVERQQIYSLPHLATLVFARIPLSVLTSPLFPIALQRYALFLFLQYLPQKKSLFYSTFFHPIPSPTPSCSIYLQYHHSIEQHIQSFISGIYSLIPNLTSRAI